MDMFFRETITNSPIKNRMPLRHQPSYSFDMSFISDASYECCSTDPETGLLYVCRRSPRLLANGYYVLTEDSFVTDDQGNLTFSPAQTSISYKENLARIFRRRRKTRRSFATLLNDVSQSLLSESIFDRDDTLSSPEMSACLDINSKLQPDTFVSFKYDSTARVPSKDKEPFLPEMDFLSEDGSAAFLPVQTINSLTDDLPPSKCSCTLSNPASDAVFKKGFFVLLFTLCICANMFSRYLCAGIAVAVVFLFLILSACGSRSGTAHTMWTKSDDILSRNE